MEKEKYLKNIFQETLNNEKKNFSSYATFNKEAKRSKKEKNNSLRGPFAIDRDRILYSGAYRRYQGKTQVVYFSNLFDEEMSNRSLHTTYVSQVSRTIAKILKLNLELVEAIALGHDLGHTPFGHDGEQILSKYCEEYGIGSFHHNVESLHIVDSIANNGNGMNLTFQVRDGIVSHDGEVHDEHLKPDRSKNEKDLQNYVKQRKKKEVTTVPATLEGCVVRISDTIAYIGQDIEDAIRLGFLTRAELPKNSTQLLGSTNSQIIDSLVKSVVLNSYGHDYVSFDKETSDALYELKSFNYKRIYTHGVIKKEKSAIKRGMKILFQKYLDDIANKNRKSKIYEHFLDGKSETYLEKFSPAEKVRDFIATMTDRYFHEELKQFILPGKVEE
ncbi:MAG: HD domain-containing protein [Candidatus Cloacimonetes bacterium]|nr:HD domain-containing protein [Candidatus Cloacimonadota bacterium]MBS3766729.1 HD domain-containing protein [Candidatus Cloacimonadota bacterium]